MNLFFALVSSCMALFSPTQAATVGSGGVEGLVVGGKIYNVSFIAGTCQDLFPPCDSVSNFPFAAGDPSQKAAMALANAIDTSSFRNTPTDFMGCESSGIFGCSIATPNGFQPAGITGFGANVLPQGPVESFDGRFFTKDAGESTTFVTFATWELVAPIPLPATVVFLITGLSGLVLMRRNIVH
ncbi:MAG: VPLPA-CTERM sorting domain-containing protein [Pseudomonadota bacterium]